MRQKRAKTYRKLMSLYSLSFGFRQPYQLLVDSEFCKDAKSLNTDLLKQLSTVLQGSVKPMITQCCIHELYLQGKEKQPAVDLAKSFERRKCNHREAVPGDECLASVVGESNKHRYVIASQSNPLRARLRKIPAVPIVHITRSVMILEPPSEATLAAKEAAEEDIQKPSTDESSKIRKMDEASASATEPPRKKRQGPKGPNPLSMKKKKPKPDDNGRTRGRGISTERKTTTSVRDQRVGDARSSTSQISSGAGYKAGAKRKRDVETAAEGLVDKGHQQKTEILTSREERARSLPQPPASRNEGLEGPNTDAGHKRKRRRKGTGTGQLGQPERATGGAASVGDGSD